MPVVNFPSFRFKKRVTESRRRALDDMDVDLSRKATKADEIRHESLRTERLRGKSKREDKDFLDFCKQIKEGQIKEEEEAAPQSSSKDDQPSPDAAASEEECLSTAEAAVEAEADATPEAPAAVVDEIPAVPKKPVSKTLGVSVFHLKHVFLEEANLPIEWTMNEIEDMTSSSPGVIRMNSGDITCPIDGKMGAAYVHCLQGEDDVGEATHFLSYSWRCPIGDIIATLYDYCETNDLSTNRTYIWMDCLCINQHRVAEKYAAEGNDSNKPTVEDFQTMFQEQIIGVAGREGGRFLAMMDPPIEAPTYLTRLWCLYEMYYAKIHGCEIDIVMPPKEKQAIIDDVIGEHGGMDGLFKALGSTKIQNCQTSHPEDKEILLQLIEKEGDGGGCEKVNNTLIEILRGWMKSNFHYVLDQQTTTDDLNFSGLCSSVGLLLWDNQECDDALELLHKSAAIQEKSYGEDHPDTAITYNNIGLVLKDKGDYEAALKLFRKCLAIDEATYGKDDPGTADSYSNIACVLLDKGDYDDALVEYKKCLSIQEATLGNDHYDTATTYKSVGTVLEAKGDYDAALAEYQKCLNIQFASLGNDHPSTKSCLDAIKSLKEKMDTKSSSK